MSTGNILDTYLHRLQNDPPDIPEPHRIVGVVRKPMYGLSKAVDENRPDLGPPLDLLHKTKQLEQEFGNPEAWEKINFKHQYKKYINESPDARSELEDLINLLQDGTNLLLVCYENTENKRCHRTLLKELLEDRLDG